MRDLLSRPDTLPAVSDGAREASIAFKSLLTSLSLQKDSNLDDSPSDNKCCPSAVQGNSSRVEIPCGMAEDSAVTLVGVPIGKNGSSRFGIELIGSDLGSNDAAKRPIVLSWNVSLDPKQPVIYQNFWLPENGWGELDKCPGTRPVSTSDGNKGTFECVCVLVTAVSDMHKLL
jgi:hydroxyproline O-galactosyltransferase 2/3/4/5/6